MSNTINIDELNSVIRDALDEYNENVVKGLKKQTKRAMKDLVNHSIDTAPVGDRDRHYRDSISSKTLEETKYGITKVWYVKGSDYRLTHLLENGHANRDGGRTEGTHFLRKAVNNILPWYISSIEEVIRNG